MYVYNQIKSKHILNQHILTRNKNNDHFHILLKISEEPINCNQKRKKNVINGNRNTWKRITFV